MEGKPLCDGYATPSRLGGVTSFLVSNARRKMHNGNDNGSKIELMAAVRDVSENMEALTQVAAGECYDRETKEAFQLKLDLFDEEEGSCRWVVMNERLQELEDKLSSLPSKKQKTN